MLCISCVSNIYNVNEKSTIRTIISSKKSGADIQNITNKKFRVKEVN